MLISVGGCSRPIRTRYEWCLVRLCHTPRSAVTLEQRCGTNPPVPCDNMLRLFTLIYMRVHRDSHWQWLWLSSCVQQLPPCPPPHTVYSVTDNSSSMLLFIVAIFYTSGIIILNCYFSCVSNLETQLALLHDISDFIF